MHDAWDAWTTVYKTVAAILESPPVPPWHPPFLYILSLYFKHLPLTALGISSLGSRLHFPQGWIPCPWSGGSSGLSPSGW